jgi:hypothetical protein
LEDKVAVAIVSYLTSNILLVSKNRRLNSRCQERVESVSHEHSVPRLK